MGRKKKEPGDIPPVDKSDSTVVTFEDLQKEKPIEKPVKEKPLEKKKPANIQYECSYAFTGDSKTIITYKMGTEIIKRELLLHNKLFDYPNNLTVDEDRALKKALKENGFHDVTVIEGAIYDKEKKDYIYSAMHPDHSKQDPFTANISVPILDEAGRVICNNDGKQIFKQIAVVNGLVKTEDKRIYQALIKAGFKSCFSQEKVRK